MSAPAEAWAAAEPARWGGPRRCLGLPAPAKINLFLHVVDRRPDGYHEIESVFLPISLADTVDLIARDDGSIVREGDLTGPVDQDLAVRAAQVLQAAARAATGACLRRHGVTLRVGKSIPVGAGLGGGSSDAATVLIGLNRLWGLHWPRQRLADLGRRLGADVPFFLGDGPAFVGGIGELCTALQARPGWVVVLYPQIAVSTAEIFTAETLTRSSQRMTIAGFSAALANAGPGQAGAADLGGDGPGAERVGAKDGKAVHAGSAVPAWSTSAGFFGANDLEPVARQRVPAVDQALRLLGRYAPARMTGSGSAVFCLVRDAQAAEEVALRLRAQMPSHWQVWPAAILEALPLAIW